MDILYKSTFDKMGLRNVISPQSRLLLVNFTGETLHPLGTVISSCALVSNLGVYVHSCFLVVNAYSGYNAFVGRGSLNQFGAVVYTLHLLIKFSTPKGVGEENGNQEVSNKCHVMAFRRASYIANIEGEVEKRNQTPEQFMDERRDAEEPIEDVRQVQLDKGKIVNMGTCISDKTENLIQFLQANQDIFAWSTTDMPRYR